MLLVAFYVEVCGAEVCALRLTAMVPKTIARADYRCDILRPVVVALMVDGKMTPKSVKPQ